MRLLAIVLCCLLAAACGRFPYRIDVQQGNYVTQDLVARLKVGMTKSDVRQLLGTPLLNDVFHADRWDYLFTHVKGGQPEPSRRVTILFKDDRVVSFTGEGQPPAPAPVGAAPVAAPR